MTDDRERNTVGATVAFRWTEMLVGGLAAASPVDAAELPVAFEAPVAHLTVWVKSYLGLILGAEQQATALPGLLVGPDTAAAIIAQLQHAAEVAGWGDRLAAAVDANRASLRTFTAQVGPMYGAVFNAHGEDGTGPGSESAASSE